MRFPTGRRTRLAHAHVLSRIEKRRTRDGQEEDKRRTGGQQEDKRMTREGQKENGRRTR